MARLTKKLFLITCISVIAFFGHALLPWNKLPADAKADKITVIKSSRILSMYHGNTLLKSYRISLGSNPIGPKQYEGDGRTPEGGYTVENRNKKSSCYLGLRTSYPSISETKNAERKGRSPGGDIMIHGLLNGLGWIGRWHRWMDWTAGCIAVTDAEMDELWRAVPDGTPIEIYP